MNKHTIKKLLAAAMVLATLLTMTACLGAKGPGAQLVPEYADGRTVIFFQAGNVDAQKTDAYNELVKTYNETVGAADNVYVQYQQVPGDISGLDSGLRANYQHDVIELDDDQYKALVQTGNAPFVALDQFLTDEAKAAMAWDEIPANLINRFRMNSTLDESDKKYLAGEGADLLALPNGSSPHVLFYNKTLFRDTCGFNIIAVPESELEAYNAKNNAKLAPHGYAEYKEAPFEGAKSFRNEKGELVYKVLNENIPMSWEELRIVSRTLQTQYDFNYGYMSEWWFNYGFGVGGDCVGWNESRKQYDFTLTDSQPGWLALEDITVGGVQYKKGEALNYDEKCLVNNDSSVKSSLSGKIAQLPSQYDAILEFTRLGVPADKEVEPGVTGYGVAPSTTANRNQRFLSGDDCAMLVESYYQTNSFKTNLANKGKELGIMMPAQYRSYVGGATYTEGGVEYLKVIGESYGGTVYTGQLEQINGTPIVGEIAAASSASGFFLPANTKNKNYEAAFKFASWAAGPEGQKILAKSNARIPNQSAYALGEYSQDTDARMGLNVYPASVMSLRGDIGDYTYFTSLTWITEWSRSFNSDVREGRLQLSLFAQQKTEAAENGLKAMALHIKGR